MDSESNNQKPSTQEASPIATPQPVPPQPVMQQPSPQFAKKPANKLLYIIAAAVILIAVGVGAYFMFFYTPTTPANNGKSGSGKASTSDQSTIGSISSILTDDADSESLSIKTDDSGLATDAGSAANNVGDGIDENNIK